jgi:hypothetical protein
MALRSHHNAFYHIAMYLNGSPFRFHRPANSEVGRVLASYLQTAKIALTFSLPQPMKG